MSEYLRKVQMLLVASVILLSIFACRPVVTISWGEILFIFALLAILLGPTLFRLYRRMEELRKHERSQEKERKGQN